MSDSKYIVFRRDEFLEELAQSASFESVVVRDAVVIRRQDLFASPCLATYASMIAMVAKNISDADQAKELMAIADYFEDQARLAAEEGYKLPDR